MKTTRYNSLDGPKESRHLASSTITQPVVYRPFFGGEFLYAINLLTECEQTTRWKNAPARLATPVSDLNTVIYFGFNHNSTRIISCKTSRLLRLESEELQEIAQDTHSSNRCTSPGALND